VTNSSHSCDVEHQAGRQMAAHLPHCAPINAPQEDGVLQGSSPIETREPVINRPQDQITRNIAA
jgi:hypothetical protein